MKVGGACFSLLTPSVCGQGGQWPMLYIGHLGGLPNVHLLRLQKNLYIFRTKHVLKEVICLGENSHPPMPSK